VPFAAQCQGRFPGRLSKRADVAQLVEQLIRNQQVVSSSLTVGSTYMIRVQKLIHSANSGKAISVSIRQKVESKLTIDIRFSFA
jgi:CRISPR/Cas system type I-B associated protein Csh2 (Cas7 group RAMP superfamily)